MSRRLSKSAASCSAAICAVASVLNAPEGLPNNNSANRSAATEKNPRRRPDLAFRNAPMRLIESEENDRG